MKPAPGQPPTEDVSEVDLPRLYAFSDGVFAIAITLLALEIRFPEAEPEVVADQFWPLLATITPSVLAFVQSFLIIGIYWIVHHRMFRLIKRGDNTLLWLNLVFLLVIAFLPVPSAVVARSLFQPVTMTFYTSCVALLGLVNMLLWGYASHKHRLIDSALEPAQVRYIMLRAAVVPLVSFVALGVYFFWPSIMYFYGFLMMFGFFLIRLFRRAKRLPVAS